MSRTVIVWVAAYVTWLAILLFVLPGAAGASDVHWNRASASTFGGPCQPSEHTGYRGDYLPDRWQSFAELSTNFTAPLSQLDFAALGHLPHNARVRVLNPQTRRRLTIRKRDVGRGGPPIRGHRRRIDLYWKVTRYLDPSASCSSWSGVLLWRRL